MQEQYFREYARALGRDMEFKVYGHAGRPVLAFPSQDGRFFDFKDNGMVDCVGHLIDAGRVQIVFTRALPVNELEIAQTVSTYRGLVPDRLLLTQVPFVEDARAVLGEEDAGQGDEEE